jgi:hypothetical protein
MTEKFKFGTVTVPDGTRGAWTVDTMTLTDDDVMMSNLRAARDGNHYMSAHRALTSGSRIRTGAAS